MNGVAEAAYLCALCNSMHTYIHTFPWCLYLFPFPGLSFRLLSFLFCYFFVIFYVPVQ